MKTQLLIYRGGTNLGDAIQSIAMSRLLPGELLGVYRDGTDRCDPAIPFVVNGWLGDPTPTNSNCIFAGIFIGARQDQQIQWIKRSAFPVGSRDPHTAVLLAQNGLDSDMVGCATLTFEKFRGLRTGRFVVDCDIPKGLAGLTRLSNTIFPMTWHEQWAMAVARLETIKKAELVITSRLHIALPCLAFGTPVIIRRDLGTAKVQPERLTLLDAIAAHGDEPIVMDVTGYANRYVKWLALQLNAGINPGDRRCPTPVE